MKMNKIVLLILLLVVGSASIIGLSIESLLDSADSNYGALRMCIGFKLENKKADTTEHWHVLPCPTYSLEFPPPGGGGKEGYGEGPGPSAAIISITLGMII